jgi:cytochrome b subunit of formate dehydrogenase
VTRRLVFALVLLSAPAAEAEEPACFECHEAKDAQPAGIHRELACTDCHSGTEELPHPEKLPAVDCSGCHSAEASEHAQSAHAMALAQGAKDAASCRSCHGAAHAIVSSSDAASPVAKANQAATCGGCHANPEFMARHAVALAHPVEAYRLSVHGRAVAAGNLKAAACSDCHGAHAIVPSRDVRSPIHRTRVPETCGTCHAAVRDAYAGSIHGQSHHRGVKDAPTCTDCHGEHAILAASEPMSLVNPTRVSAVTCGRCHGDERLAARYNLPSDKVPTFADSYHGLAARSGSQTVANCASCHGVHDILPSRDPRSTVHPANLARTCGACHPGAGQRFAIGPIHAAAGSANEHPVVRFIRWAYLFLIPATLGFMVLHNALDFGGKLVRGPRTGHAGGSVPRMNLQFRIAHGLVVLSFPVLVLTGFALKYPDAWWASPLVAFEGRAAFRGLVHRIAGVLLLLAMAYHAIHLLRVPRDRVILKQLVPRLQDLRDLLAALRHSLGRGEAPRFGMFSYAEKAEYLAFVWGTVIMAVSGFVLWFDNWSLRNFPKWASDAATALHWYEAILATAAIVIWHFYMVIFDPDVYPMDKAWITGRASAAHTQATRPDYFRALMEEKARKEESAAEALEKKTSVESASGPEKKPAGGGES